MYDRTERPEAALPSPAALNGMWKGLALRVRSRIGHDVTWNDQPIRPAFIEQGRDRLWFVRVSEWPVAGRVKWLKRAANIFDLIYKGDGGISVNDARADR